MGTIAFPVSFWPVGIILCLWLSTPLLAASKLRIGYSAISATQVPLWAAEDRGLFKKYGIDAELIYLAGGSKIALALESESIQMGRFNVASGVDARLAGASLLVIGSFYDYYYFQIFGKPALQNPSQLKGKVIAASSPGSASEYGIHDALAHFGLKENDYKILYAGGTDSRVQALQQGLADAAIISPPNGLIAQKLGFREIANLMEMKIPFGYGGLVAKERWLRQNRETVLNFFRGYLEALAALRQDQEYALRMIGKFSRISDREILLESYRTSIPQTPIRPYVKREIVEKALKMSKKEAARRADPEKFYDNSSVQELDDSGFIASLFGKN
ncbi:MAG: ABC transporter substrate-binding protein [Deltaproteobacteria bacterium]|nr:ABC transporter substrate-binding protein [Deltaproteobacteria bacterium]